MESEFPPNSVKSRQTPPQEEKKIEQVVSGEVKRRKKSLGRQFKETFISGDMKTSVHYGFFDVLVPSAQVAVVQALEGWIRSLFLGDSKFRGVTPRTSTATGRVDYGGYSRINRQTDDRPPTASMTNRGRANHNFDEIVLETREEARNVVDNLFEIVSKFGQASVSDLYTMVGEPSTHVDHMWGWTDIRGAGQSKVHGGWLVDLPQPEPLSR